MTQMMTRASSADSAVAGALQETLVELINLSLQAKQAHWMVVGPHFRTIHAQLDDMVAAYRAWSDQVAERGVTIGVAMDGRAATVARSSSIEAFPEGEVKDDDVIDMFVSRLDAMVGRLRERLASSEADLVTQDLLISITGGLEMQRWMLQAQRG